MCARREDLIEIGGADEDLCYLGYICGPYDMTFRLRNKGLKEVWHESEFLFHTWHPGADGGGVKNYMGPHDGERMSALAIESIKTGRIRPFCENRAIQNMKIGKRNPDDLSESVLISPGYTDEWRYEGIHKREDKHLQTNPHPFMIRRQKENYPKEEIVLRIINFIKSLTFRRVIGYPLRWLKALIRLSNTRVKVKEYDSQIKSLDKRLDAIEYGSSSSLDVLQKACALANNNSISYKFPDKIYQNISECVDVLKCSSFERKFVSQLLADEFEKIVPRKGFSFDRQNFNTLIHEGIVTLNDCTLSKGQIDDLNKYFSRKKVFNSHVYIYSDKEPYEVEKLRLESPIGSYRSADTINAPHLLDLALNPKVLGIVEQYLGCAPTIYSMNSWRYFPGYPQTGPQDFHRDIDDYKFLALFLFLSDVQGGESGGQFQYIKRTHDEGELAKLTSNISVAGEFFPPKLKNHGYKNSDLYKKIFSAQIEDFIGPAGSVFLSDTFGLHRGVPPQFNDRFVCWIRYGYGQNWAYKNDGIEAVMLEQKKELDPYSKFVTRNIVHS